MANTTKRILEFVLQASDKTKQGIGKASKTLGKLKDQWEDIEEATESAGDATEQYAKDLKKLKVRPLANIQKEVKETQAAFKRLASSGKLSQRELAIAADKTRKKLKRLNREMLTGTKHANALAKAFGAVGGALTLIAGAAVIANIIKDTAAFDDAIRAAGATAQASAEQVQQFSDAAREMGATTRFTATQAAEALRFLSMAGLSVEESTAALPETLKLASAGMLDIGKAADIVTNVMTGYGFSVDELTRVNDVLVSSFTNANTDLTALGTAFQYVGPIAKSAGLEFEETAAILSGLAQAGIRGSAAGTTLRAALAALLKPTPKATKVFEKLGLQVQDSSGQMLPMINILDQIRKSGANTADVLEIFGRRAGPGVAALLSQGDAALKGFLETLRNSSGVAAQVSADMEAGVGGAIRVLISQFEELKLASGELIEPRFTALIKELTETLAENKKAIAELVNSFYTMLEVLVRIGVGLGVFVAQNKGIVASVLVLTAAIYSLGRAVRLVEATNVAGGFKAWSALNIPNMTAGITKLASGFNALKVAITSLSRANLILLALTTGAAALAAAWALFSKSSLEAVKNNREIAEAAGKQRKEIGVQLSNVKILAKAFKDSAEGTNEYAVAQRKLADILPGAILMTDEQGKLVLKIGGIFDDATTSVNEHIAALEKQQNLLFAIEIENTVKALDKATQARKNLVTVLTEELGEGEKQKTLYQKVNILLVKAQGLYESSKEKLKPFSEEIDKNNNKLKQLAEGFFKSGKKIEDFQEILEGGALTPDNQKKALDFFRAFESGIQKSGEDAKTLTENLKDVVVTTENLGEVTKAANEKLQTGIPELKQAYVDLGASIDETHKSRTDVIDRNLQEELNAIRESGKNQQEIITKTAEAFRRAQDERVNVIADSHRQQIQLIDDVGEKQIAAEKARGGDVAGIERDILLAKKAIYDQTVDAYQATIDQLIAEERRHLAEAKRIMEQRENFTRSIEDRIRILRQKGMSDEEAIADRSAQLLEKQAAAQKAFAEGNFELAIKLSQQANSLAERQAQSVDSAVSNVEAATSRVEQLQNRINDARQDLSEVGQDTGDSGARESARSRVQDAQKELSEAQNDLNEARSGVEEAKGSVTTAITSLQTNQKLIEESYTKMEEVHRSAAAALAEEKLTVSPDLEAAQVALDDFQTQLTDLAVINLQVETAALDEAILKLQEIGSTSTEHVIEFEGTGSPTLPITEKVNAIKEEIVGITAAAYDAITLVFKVQGKEEMMSAASLIASISNKMITLSVRVIGMESVNALKRVYDDLIDKTVTVTVKTIEAKAGGGVAGDSGGFRRPTSSLVNTGSSLRDSVKTLLMRGEYIFNQSSVKRLGTDLLDSLQYGAGAVQRMANGGLAGASSVASLLGRGAPDLQGKQLAASSQIDNSQRNTSSYSFNFGGRTLEVGGRTISLAEQLLADVEANY